MGDQFQLDQVPTFITYSGRNKDIDKRFPGLLGCFAGAEDDGENEAAKWVVKGVKL